MKPYNLLMAALQLAAITVFPTFAKAQNCSQEEVEFMSQNQEEGQSIAAGCYLECILSDNQDSCVVACMSEAYPQISDSCMQCAPPQMQCVTEACWLPCLFPNSAACEECVIENCGPAFLQCIGDDDGDGFTVDGGDCDNADPFINPLAEDMEGDGIDQNCDGTDGIALDLIAREQSPIEIVYKNGEIQLLSEHYGELCIYSITGMCMTKIVLNENRKSLIPEYKGIVIYTFETDTRIVRGTLSLLN